jgi:hypothetical protein
LDVSFYDEYQIVINEAQRRLIMRALTNAMANDRLSTKGGSLTRPTCSARLSRRGGKQCPDYVVLEKVT